MKRMAFTLAVMLSATGLAQAKNLTGDQIQKALVGKNLTFTASGGGKNKAYYAPDGSAKITLGGKPDKGTWRVSGSKMCAKWTWIRDGKESCFTVAPAGDNVYKTSTGVTISVD